LRKIPLTRCSVFKDQVLVVGDNVSPATLIIYHVRLCNASSFFKFYSSEASYFLAGIRIYHVWIFIASFFYKVIYFKNAAAVAVSFNDIQRGTTI